MRNLIASTSLIALAAVSAPAAIADTSESFQGAAKDAWLTGRIETMYLLNEHLSPFAISTDVENGIVHLTGTVQSDIDRDLAGALAGNLDGVAEVENDLLVDTTMSRTVTPENDQRMSRRNFGTWIDDATTTAGIKTRLIGNANTKGLKIDVDTDNDVVTLSGRVDSEAEKDLAEEIARDVSDVSEVRNNLVVDPS